MYETETKGTPPMNTDEIAALLARATEVRAQAQREVAAAENRAREAVKAVDRALAEGSAKYRWTGEKKPGRQRPTSYLATHQPLGWRDPQTGSAQALELRMCHDMGYTATRTATGTRQAPRESVTGEVDGVRYRNGICIELATWKVCRQGSRGSDSSTFYVCDAHLEDEHNPHLHGATAEPAPRYPGPAA
jgi:hypothetical protein